MRRPSISISKLIFSTGEAPPKYFPTLPFASILNIRGGEILTASPIMSDMAVAADPIIWFMTSLIALKWISSSTGLSS